MEKREIGLVFLAGNKFDFLKNALKNRGSTLPPLQSALGKFPLEKSGRGSLLI